MNLADFIRKLFLHCCHCFSGSQAFISEEAYKQTRDQRSSIAPVKEKKTMKHGKSKKIPEPEMTLAQEDDMDRAAIELAKKMAAARIDLQVEFIKFFDIVSLFYYMNDNIIINGFLISKMIHLL